MTASFTRTQREGETWIDLGNGKLLITHAERQPIVIDTDGEPPRQETVSVRGQMRRLSEFAPPAFAPER